MKSRMRARRLELKDLEGRIEGGTGCITRCPIKTDIYRLGRERLKQCACYSSAKKGREEVLLARIEMGQVSRDWGVH